MLVTLGCNSSEEKQSETTGMVLEKIVHPKKDSTPIEKDPIVPDCSHTLLGKRIRNVNVYNEYGFLGTGGMYKEQGKNYLITASHLFKSGRVAYFFVPDSKDTLYVAEKKIYKDDAVVMELSRTKKKFHGFSSYSDDALISERWSYEAFFDTTLPKKFHTLCGESFNCIGYLVNEPNFEGAAVILKKEMVRGESGTIFYSDEGNVYVVSQLHTADTSEGYKMHGVLNNEATTLLRPVGFTISVENAPVLKTVFKPWAQ